MPKIAAANIEEHVRVQAARLLDAARSLFSAKGYRGTDMGDIAKSMGLARNSLYRYYPSKDHILVAVMQRDMAPFVDQARALDARYPDPTERIDAWLDLQIELVTGPCHATINMLGDMGEASPELRQEIMGLHEPSNTVLASAVAQCLEGSSRDPVVVSAVIAGMVRSAGTLVLKSNGATVVVRELKESVGKILKD